MDACDEAALRAFAEAGFAGDMPVRATPRGLPSGYWVDATILAYAKDRQCAAGIALFPVKGAAE